MRSTSPRHPSPKIGRAHVCSSHVENSYAVFCLKKKKKERRTRTDEPGSVPTLANWKEHPMRHPMKCLIAVALCAGMALPALPAKAKAPGPNGRIAFSRG